MEWNIFDDQLQKVARVVRKIQAGVIGQSLEGIVIDVVTMNKTEKDEAAVDAIHGCFAFKLDWPGDKSPSTVIFALEKFNELVTLEWEKRDWLTDEGLLEWCIWYNGKFYGDFQDFTQVSAIVKEELTKPDLKKEYEYELEASPFVIFLSPKVATNDL